MPGRFKLDDRVTCVRNSNALGQRHAGKISKVTEGTRDHSSNHNSDFAVCLYCFLDALTCGALKPNDLWYYSIKYDDGEEEHKVGPARIFRTNGASGFPPPPGANLQRVRYIDLGRGEGEGNCAPGPTSSRSTSRSSRPGA